MAIRQQYALDLVPNRMWVHVPCSQYDKQSRIIEFLIYNDNNDFEIPTGALVYVHGTKKDGTGFEYQCSFSGNVVQMVIEEQMTVFHGNVLCELRIVQGNQILGTSNFYLDVEISPLNDDTVISETELPLLQEAIDASVSALQSAQSAQQSAQSVSALIPSNVGTDDQFLAKDGNGAIWKDAVSSFNGRSGDVVPTSDDYDATQISYSTSNVGDALDSLVSKTTDLIIAQSFSVTYTWTGDSTGTVNVPITIPDGYTLLCACDAVTIGRGARCAIQNYTPTNNTVSVYWEAKGITGSTANTTMKVLCLFVKS